MEDIEINKILFRGKYRLCNPPLIMTGLKEHKYGYFYGEIDGYKCPRCKSDTGITFKEKDIHISFCATNECLQSDAQASKGELHN